MPNKAKSLRPARDRSVAKLVDRHSKHGVLTPEDYRAEARACGYSTKQLRRRVNAQLSTGTPERGDGFIVDETVIEAVYLKCGNVAGAHRMLEAEGVELPSKRTFQRKVKNEMHTSQLTYAKGGTARYRDVQLYLKHDYPHRLHTILLDHTEAPIWVIQRNHKHAVKPWITVAMDAKTRYPLAWVVTFDRPSVAEVRSVLVQSMDLRLAPDGETWVGGRPQRAVWDRGLEFLANSITHACARLGVIAIALPAYSPHLKAQLERFWRFFKTDALAHLPGYTDGPRDLRGQSALERHAITEDAFLVKVAEWFEWYVTKHVISTEGKTPLQMWKEDGTPLEEVAPEQLWLDFLVSEKRLVSKNGVNWDNILWVAPEMARLVGETVELRHLPHDRTFVEVFHNGKHVATAIPNDQLTDEDRHQILMQRKADQAEARAWFTKSNGKRTKSAPTRRIGKDENGKRIVIDDEDDLLAGGQQALSDFTGDDPDQLRVF